MSIILLRGFSQSGKDYVGNILCKQYNYKRFAFADSLKRIVAQNFRCPLELLHSQEGKKQLCESDSEGRTHRQILIDEAARLRDIDADIFAKELVNEVSSPETAYKKIVITDWRYPNELDVITKMLPKFKITPVHVMRISQIESPIADTSEYHLIDRLNDFTIMNCMDRTIHDEIEDLINYIRVL
jgi:hypothetical protein